MDGSTDVPDHQNISNVYMPQVLYFDIIYYTYTVGEIVIAISAIAGNALLIYVICNRPQLHTSTNWITASLAAADLLVGLIGIPCALVGFNGKPTNAYGCLMVNTTIIILTQISIFGLLVIATERFTAIRFPYEYSSLCTPGRAAIVIVIYWVLAIAVGMIPMFGWNVIEQHDMEQCLFQDVIDMDYMVYFNFIGCVLTPLFVILLIYCYIFKEVQKQNQRIANLQVEGTNNAQNQNEESQKKAIWKKELKAAKWFAIVIGFFAVCWIPMHIINAVGSQGIYYPLELLLFTILLSHLNSAVNPVLYGYSNSRIKNAMKKTLRITMQETSTVLPLP